MINISLNSKNEITEGTIEVRGDGETLVDEIFVILRSLSKESPRSFYAAVEKHLEYLREGEG